MAPISLRPDARVVPGPFGRITTTICSKITEYFVARSCRAAKRVTRRVGHSMRHLRSGVLSVER